MSDSKSGLSPAAMRNSLRAGLLVLFVLTFLLLDFGCQEQAGLPSKMARPSGAELFESKCGKCHDLERALEKNFSEELWRSTIIRMKEAHGADISREDIEKLVRYHVQRQKDEAALFHEKCEKCHPGKVFLEKRLSPEQAREIIKRMQRKAGNDISDPDVEIIVRYHVRAQQEAFDKSLRAVNDVVLTRHNMKAGMELFLKKCTTCHEASRALSVIKDPAAWERTIRRMQAYSKGGISDRDVKELVNFHLSVQEKEIDTFRQTCTKCHSDARINSRSLTEEQWLTTIKRMQRKAPELITDEKVRILAAYFHRRELTLARIFLGKCRLCHAPNAGAMPPTTVNQQVDGLIAVAKQEFGREMLINDVNNLMTIHVQRQNRNLQFFESDCTACHPYGLPSQQPPKGEKATERKTSPARSRAEWISFIAALEGKELDKNRQETIDSQIDFHIARHRTSRS